MEPETGSVTVTNLVYNLAAATNTPLPPVDFLAVVVDNTQNSIPITQTITLTGSVQQSTQIESTGSDTEGTAYTQSFSVSASFPSVDVSASATFEENHSTTVGWSNGTATANTSEHDIQTEVTVPGNKKYSLQQRVNYGQVNVPWTATGTFQSCVSRREAVHVPDERHVHRPQRHHQRGHRGGRHVGAARRAAGSSRCQCRCPRAPLRCRRCKQRWPLRVAGLSKRNGPNVRTQSFGLSGLILLGDGKRAGLWLT